MFQLVVVFELALAPVTATTNVTELFLFIFLFIIIVWRVPATRAAAATAAAAQLRTNKNAKNTFRLPSYMSVRMCKKCDIMRTIFRIIFKLQPFSSTPQPHSSRAQCVYHVRACVCWCSRRLCTVYIYTFFGFAFHLFIYLFLLRFDFEWKRDGVRRENYKNKKSR